MRELLARHAQGRLTPAEEGELARALQDAQGELPAAEAAWLQRTAAQLRAQAQAPPGLAEQGLSVLLARIHAEDAAAPKAAAAAPARVGWLQRAAAVAATLFGPRAPVLAAALGVLVLVQAGALAVLMGRAPAQQESLGAAPAAARADVVLLTVGFAPTATESAIRTLLAAAGGQLVAGPSALGLYTVAVPRARADAAVSALRAATGVVQSVQR